MVSYSQRILASAPSTEVLVVPYIMKEFTFGIIAQGSLKVTDFTTNFSFIIKTVDDQFAAEGLAFTI